MSSSGRVAWKVFAVLYVVAVALNFPWELLQSPLYRMEAGSLPPWFYCLRASLGDGVLVLLILVLGEWVFGSMDWFRRPEARGYVWMLTAGLFLAVSMEWTSVHMLERWSYEPTMPLIPGLRIGLVPIAQMLVLPPAIFAVAARLAPRRHRHKEQS